MGQPPQGYIATSSADSLNFSGVGTGSTGRWQLINDGEGVFGLNWPPTQSQSGERFQFINRVITNDLLTGGVAFAAPQTGVAAARINADTGLIMNANGTLRLQFDFPNNGIAIDGNITSFKGIATAGKGIPPIFASHTSTGNTGAVTNAINYVPPAVAGTYRIQAVVNVTAWTTPASFTAPITYKDASGNARTDTMAMDKDTGTLQAAGAINAVDRFYGYPTILQIDNSATAITLSTSGTFTGSPVYNLAAILEQLA